MKKQYVSLLVILLAASGFLFSCGNTMNKNAGALEFDSIQVNEPTCSQTQQSPDVTLTSTLPMPANHPTRN